MLSQADKNIIETFLASASKHADQVALIQDETQITYAKLANEVIATASYFQSKGIGKGDKVLVFVPMSIPLYRTVLALFYLGACPVFLDERVSIARLKACLKVVPCKVIIANRGLLFLSTFIAPLRRIPIRINASRYFGTQTANLNAASVSANNTALVTFTTGSTGTPKAADRTHSFLHAQLEALQPLLTEVVNPCLTTLPIVVLLHLAEGRTTLLPPKRFKAAKPKTIKHLTESLSKINPKSLIASPAIVDGLVRCTEQPRIKAALAEVKTLLTGGGPVYPDLAAKMIISFSSASITAVYGSTEAEPISHIDARKLSKANLDSFLEKGLPVGVPDPAAEVAILKLNADISRIGNQAQFNSLLELPGKPGEIIVSGDHVLQHYINNPEAEAATKLRIGGKLWHRTGDCGMMDENGELYLLGRCIEIVQWKGRTFYPAIVSYALRELAGIESSALLMLKDDVVLVLEKSKHLNLTQINEALLKLGLAEVPIKSIKKIPKDPRHQTKVDYEKLKRLL
jgi:acyl-CoA synthetase (AMP-forming)/AMP-acid ligase II